MSNKDIDAMIDFEIKMTNDIAEYRSLRRIMEDLCAFHNDYTRANIEQVLGTRLFERMEYLDKSTWPDRNVRFRAFNDALL